MSAAPTRPKLAGKARLRWDGREKRFMLLYPERGLLLNNSAAEIARCCDGQRTVVEIVDHLMQRFGGQSRSAIEEEVDAFLVSMAQHGLLEREG